MKAQRLILSALVSALVVASPLLALAEPSKLAREHFESAQQSYEKGDYEAAAASFRSAYEETPSASFIYNEAVCYEHLSDSGKAKALFERYLELAPQASDRVAVAARIAALGQGPGAATAEKPPDQPLRGVVFVDSRPPGATIYIDDRKSAPVGQTPWDGILDGTHTIIVVAQGYKDEKKLFTARPGSFNQLYIAMSQQEYLSWLEVSSNLPGADVYLDSMSGGAVGRTPFRGNVTPGKHSIIVTSEGWTQDRRELTLVAGEALRVQAVLEQAPIGFVVVNGRDVAGATVKLDGKEVCAAPCRFQTPIGEHRVSVGKSGRKGFSRTLAIRRATETELDVKLEPTQPKTGAIVRLAIGAAFAGGGTYMLIKSGQMKNDLDSDLAGGPVTDEDGRRTRQKLVMYGGVAALAVGGVTMITGIVSLLQEKGPRSSGSAEVRDLGRVSLEPAVGPDYAGLQAAFNF